MGGRGSFSGLGNTIDDVLGLNEGKGKVREIDAGQFGSLAETEDHIRKKKKEVLVVFNQSGKAVKAYQGNEHSVAFPVAEAEKWKGLTVTHNHPKGWQGFGGTFSYADMRNATVFEFASHRACASGQGEKNYILTAGKNANPMALNRRIAQDIPMLERKMKEEVEHVRLEYNHGDNQGKYKNYGHAIHIARQKSVGVLNSYYREVAERYGYVYRTQK